MDSTLSFVAVEAHTGGPWKGLAVTSSRSAGRPRLEGRSISCCKDTRLCAFCCIASPCITLALEPYIHIYISSITKILPRLTDSRHRNVGGAFILTTGFLDRTPLRGATLITAVNSAVNGFVRAAPIELAEGRRILAVSPGFIAESKYPESIRGGLPEIAVENVAKVYRRALVSGMTGKVLTITASTYIED